MLKLTVPREFAPTEATALVTALRSHIEVADPRWLVRKAADISSLPQYIELIGNWAVWAPLGIFAAAFFKKLGDRVADQAYDAFRAWLKQEEAKPLADCAASLSDAAMKSDPRMTIIVGLDVPNEYENTIFTISDTDPEKIAFQLARFLALGEKIASAVQAAESLQGRRAAGPVVVSLLDDGSARLEWKSWTTNYDNFEKHALRITSEHSED